MPASLFRLLAVIGVFGSMLVPPVEVCSDSPKPTIIRTDADDDGLDDFQEIHKYGTDPTKKASEGKGVLDGDWKQRREYAYSIRAVIRLMPAYNLTCMSDDYQDVRVLTETKQYVELEVVSYPLNTNADAISGHPTWKKDYAGMKEYLDPGVTTNWDAQMQKDLLQNLAQAGIEPDKLTDKEVVEKVSRWLLSRSTTKDMFCTYYVDYPLGKPAIYPGLEAAFHAKKGNKDWTVQQQLEHELLGKEMFYRKITGSCTSYAVYQCTALRALGIPTRMIIAIPVVDPSDQAQVEMAGQLLTHNQAGNTIFYGALSMGSAFSAHTFNEVYVGNRWRRLNYNKLGQNILDKDYLGLMVKVHEFKDLSEANLADRWGWRYGQEERNLAFPHNNPYRTLALSDHFGRNAKVANPPAADKELSQVTITKAHWFQSKDCPAVIRETWNARTDEETGYLIVQTEEWIDGPDSGSLPYRAFMMRSDKDFLFRAKGHPLVTGYITTNYTVSKDIRALEIVIPREEYAKMVKGVPYTIQPLNGHQRYQWKVHERLTITR